jgi:hypothetical protein
VGAQPPRSDPRPPSCVVAKARPLGKAQPGSPVSVCRQRCERLRGSEGGGHLSLEFSQFPGCLFDIGHRPIIDRAAAHATQRAWCVGAISGPQSRGQPYRRGSANVARGLGRTARRSVDCMNDDIAWRLVLPDGLVADLTHDATTDDFPWRGVRVRKGPMWGEVADDLKRDLELLEAGSWDEWEELWAGLRARALRLLLAEGGEVELFALHSDGTTGTLRYIES